MAWVSALLEKIQDLVDLYEMMDAAFDLDKAVGVQLDTLGEFIGTSRTLNFEPRYAASALLGDENYRKILNARISLNRWDGTIEGIYSLWSDIFPDCDIEVMDNQNMTMAVRVYGLRTMFEAEYIQAGYAAPKPHGVWIEYDFILVIELKSELFIGAKATSQRSRFRFNPKASTGDQRIGINAHVGAAATSVRTRFTLNSSERS